MFITDNNSFNIRYNMHIFNTVIEYLQNDIKTEVIFKTKPS